MWHRLPWLFVVLWGLALAALGMHAIDPAPSLPIEFGLDTPARPAIYMLVAGMVTCVVGLIGMLGGPRRLR